MLRYSTKFEKYKFLLHCKEPLKCNDIGTFCLSGMADEHDH